MISLLHEAYAIVIRQNYLLYLTSIYDRLQLYFQQRFLEKKKKSSTLCAILVSQNKINLRRFFDWLLQNNVFWDLNICIYSLVAKYGLL